MRRRAVLGALLAAGAAVPLGACERRERQAANAERKYRVGLLLAGFSDQATSAQRRTIVERLAGHGFVEGRNLEVVLKRGGRSPAEDAEAIGPLVASNPDAVLVDTSPLAQRMHAATRSIPLVFTGVADPVRLGLIGDFSRPGGNVTGVHYSQLELNDKRLELLRDLLPAARRVMVVRYLASGEIDTVRRIHDTAARLGLAIVEINALPWYGFQAPPDGSVYGKFEAIYCAEPYFHFGGEETAEQIIRYAADQRVPSFFWESAAAEGGATIAYGVNLARELGRAADQLARVLKGANPGELAVDTATEYELVVNRKAAAALGLAIPPALVARATRIIE